MAYRRSVITRGSFLARRIHPSFGYISHDEDRKQRSADSYQSPQRISDFLLRRSFGSKINTSGGFGAFFQGKGFSPLSHQVAVGSSYSRYMSTAIREGSENIGVIAETPVDLIANATVDVASEVSIAAADSFFLVGILQHLIGGVHSYTGLNWTKLMLGRCDGSLMRPRLEAIREEMQAKGMEPSAVAEGNKRMQQIFKEYGVTPFTPLKGLFIQGPVFVSFFLGISNMVQKVPSFKTGGALWFTDLTTPDSFYIMPILAGLTFLITVEFNMQDGMQGNPTAGTMKKFSRALAFLSVPFTMNFAQGIFCYWIPSNLFSLAYGFAVKQPAVKKMFGIPEIPVPPPPAKTSPSTSFSLSQALKNFKALMPKGPSSPPSLPPSSPPSLPPSSPRSSPAQSLVQPSKFEGKPISSTAVLSMETMPQNHIERSYSYLVTEMFLVFLTLGLEDIYLFPSVVVH
ncbi:Mitochondrial inner membrane protein OXA1 [Vitis vinifera]|uniref:Mitochondrial inner membrane protein OXA1 n=1 Tax=Vitis vinifera TaxID=29760 RepID=A0A438E644_VITVI|nr:Mitochondrial inner membrane protein OXA1 [Vitis vinifera]